MVIRNKRIIGVISILVGLAIFVYEGSNFFVAFYGEKTTAEISGFALHRNGVQKVQRESKSLFKGRSPFVKFRTENNQAIEACSKTLQIFTFTGYHVGEQVMVAYKPQNPQQIFIMNGKEIPGLLLMLAFSIILIAMGKNFLFPKKQKL